MLVDWNHHKIPFFSEPPALHAAHVPSTMPRARAPAQVAPGAETTGNAQFVSALGAPFVLEGLFGEADAEAMMDAEPSSPSPMMDVGDGMQIDDATAKPTRLNRKRAHSPELLSDAAGGGDPQGAFRAPKRLRRLAVRTASLPTAAIAIRSRRVERQARRKRERAAAAGMEVDGS